MYIKAELERLRDEYRAQEAQGALLSDSDRCGDFADDLDKIIARLSPAAREGGMNKFFCKECHLVFTTAKPKCCGEVVDFDLHEHGNLLIAPSNGWISVWNKWKDHPLVKKVGEEHAERGNCSAPAILNDAIARAFEQMENGDESI